MKCLAAIAVLGVMWVLPVSAAETVKLATIEWPPYNSESMPQGGATSAVISAAFAAVGVEVTYEFLPFKRAALVGTTEPTYGGYTTEYYSDEVAAQCQLSKPVGKSPVGFVKKLGSDFTWNTVADLKNVTIGVVDGYVNDGGPFDAAVAAKEVKVEAVRDDLTVIRKVAAGRNPVGVIDANVLAYLQTINKDIAGVLKMDDHLLKEHELFVCFQKTPVGEALRNKFSEGLAKINIDDEYSKYFAKNFK